MKSSLATVFYADFSSFSRIIAISDVHGDSDGFDALLQKLNFSNQDALVITGDILERGPNSLKLLQTVIRLSKNGNIFTVIGNNDTTFLNWLRGEVEDEAVCAYVQPDPAVLRVYRYPSGGKADPGNAGGQGRLYLLPPVPEV